jgi:hypothetical protein
VLAQELSKILNETLAVSHADFVNSNEAELYSFSSLEPAVPTSPIALFVQIPPLTKP